jgi:uncharacterized protein (UPF0548 family)
VTRGRHRLLGNIDHLSALAELNTREINYDPSEVRPPSWAFDVHRSLVGHEQPGPPVPHSVWETARELVRDYEFTPPEIIRAVYHRLDPLLGRNLLLEGRFCGLRFYMGVRITVVLDETRNQQERVWGWAYETLERHLERGKVTYEVVKHLDSGRVEFVASCQSQRSPSLGPILRLGWLLFGRRAQLRFYRRCGQRLRTLVQASLTGAPAPAAGRSWAHVDDVVLVPSGVQPHPLERFTIRQHDPAR